MTFLGGKLPVLTGLEDPGFAGDDPLDVSSVTDEPLGGFRL
jgi:hypothetical protein